MRTGLLYRATAAGMTSLLVWLGAAVAGPLDQDEVVPLVREGRIIPLEELLTRHRERLQGRLIDLELEHERGRLVYELELIDNQGVVREFLIDARTGQWLGEE